MTRTTGGATCPAAARGVLWALPLRSRFRIRTQRRVLLAWSALAVFALAACSSLPQAAPAQRSLAGRFALNVVPDPALPEATRDAQRNAMSGRFTLALGAGTLTLDLVSPLGATLARFEIGPHEARLLVPEGGGVQTRRGPDAQALALDVLGYTLPFDGMPDWIDGHPSGARPYRSLPPEEGRERFEQDGWSVTVEHPDAQRAGLRLTMDRPAAPGVPAVDLRVVLDAPSS